MVSGYAVDDGGDPMVGAPVGVGMPVMVSGAAAAASQHPPAHPNPFMQPAREEEKKDNVPYMHQGPPS